MHERWGPDDKEDDILTNPTGVWFTEGAGCEATDTNPVEAGFKEGAGEDTGTKPLGAGVGAGFTEGAGEDTGTVIDAGVAGNANRGCDKKYNDIHTIMNCNNK